MSPNPFLYLAFNDMPYHKIERTSDYVVSLTLVNFCGGT